MFSVRHFVQATIILIPFLLAVTLQEKGGNPGYDDWLAGIIVIGGFALIAGFVGAWLNRRNRNPRN